MVMLKGVAETLRLAGMVIALGVMANAAAAEPISDQRRDELQYLLTQDCGSCHGLTLKGGLGKPLTPDALQVYEDDDLEYVILNGRPGTPMPPWQGVLSREDVRWIVQLLRRGTKP